LPTLLRVRNLEVTFTHSRGGEVRALRGAELSLSSGEVLGLLGESGCGKSTLARTLLRLLPARAHVGGSVEFEGRNLLQLSEREMEAVRGARIVLILQDPDQALNPVMRIGDQVAEVLHAHRHGTWKQCREKSEALLARTQLSAKDRRMFEAYPHELSGGQKQRVGIAQAVACQPSLIVADEPTASLDAALECEIITLLNELRLEQKTSLLFITHNPALLKGMADRVAVMYAGRIVEEATSQNLFNKPQHPYTQALLNCMRAGDRTGSPAGGTRLPSIPGTTPDPEHALVGCSFAPRCRERMTACDSRFPTAIESGDTSRVECLLYER